MTSDWTQYEKKSFKSLLRLWTQKRYHLPLPYGAAFLIFFFGEKILQAIESAVLCISRIIHMGHSAVLGATFCVRPTCPSDMSVQCHIHNFISFIPNKTICWMGSISIRQKKGWFKCLDLHIAFIHYDYYQNPKWKTVNVTVVNVMWTNIGRTHVTFTKFQCKYCHFASKHCNMSAVDMGFDQFGIKVLIYKKIILHTFETELWATLKVSLWTWHVRPQKWCHIHNIARTFFNLL